MKLQEARCELQAMKLKKTSKNNYSNFSYFQLDDFLPHINNIFKEKKLTSRFLITANELGVKTLHCVNPNCPAKICIRYIIYKRSNGNYRS